MRRLRGLGVTYTERHPVQINIQQLYDNRQEGKKQVKFNYGPKYKTCQLILPCLGSFSKVKGNSRVFDEMPKPKVLECSGLPRSLMFSNMRFVLSGRPGKIVIDDVKKPITLTQADVSALITQNVRRESCRYHTKTQSSRNKR